VRERISIAALAVCGLALAGCASSSPEAIAAGDPFEPMNRSVYQFDETFDRDVLLPIAGFYLAEAPRPLRLGIHSVLSTAEEPVTIANDLLQLRLGAATRMAARMALNATAGLGGIVDVAANHGLPQETADFGQTLSRYGVGEGPFLVLPIIGPEPPRQLVGDSVDMLIDPLTWLPTGWPFLDRMALTTGVHIWQPYVTHARNMLLRQELE
jgi:phospholipid-binding lipoprotein MlaA